MKRLLFCLVMLLAFNSCQLKAQNHSIYGVFPTYNQNGVINEKWDYSIYSFLAIYPSEQTTEGFTYPSKSNAFYIELDGIYKINDKWSAAGSYTYERVNPFFSEELLVRNEHRAWLQAQHYFKFEKFNLKNRFRYDFRFIENEITDNYDYKPRARYLLGVDGKIGEKGNYWAAYNEVFIDTFDERITEYTENWAFVGVGFKLSERCKLETGPLLISWIRNQEQDWLHQYFLQATLITQLDLK